MRCNALKRRAALLASGFQRQAGELDRKKREALLFQIQQIMHDRVMHVPIFELAFLWGVVRSIASDHAVIQPGFVVKVAAVGVIVAAVVGRLFL